MSEKTSLTYRNAKCAETVSLEKFCWLIWYILCIYAAFFDLMKVSGSSL